MNGPESLLLFAQQQSGFPSWRDVFQPSTLPFLVAIVAIGGGILAGIITSILQHIRKVRTAEMEASLKAQMIERGMSAEEIERVLRAKTSSVSPPCPT
jgi:hypothetical protein